MKNNKQQTTSSAAAAAADEMNKSWIIILPRKLGNLNGNE